MWLSATYPGKYLLHAILFISLGGNISCMITGSRHHLSDLVQGGYLAGWYLEVKQTYWEYG